MTDRREARFRPHSVEWSATQVTRFWDFYATRAAEEEYFSAKMAPAIASALERRVGVLGRVVDVGCGAGNLLAELRARGHDALGVDSSPESVATARTRLGADGPDRVLEASFLELPFESGTVDTVVYVEVVEHVLDDSLDQLFSEAARVLRPGGRIVITTPNEEDLRIGMVQCPDCGAQFHRMQHVRSWSATTLSNALQRGGFAAIDAHAGRFIERGPWLERLVKRVAFLMRRDRIHLMAVGTRP